MIDTPSTPAADNAPTPDPTPTSTVPAAPATAPPSTAPDAAPAADASGDVAAESAPSDDVAAWKSRAREWEKRAKRNTELAARFPDLEARSKELTEQYEEAVGARARLEADLWRERAARAHGIPEDLFEFLTGSSEADVMERAERIAAKLASPRRPLPDLTQGRGSDIPASPADAFAAYLRGSLNR